MFVEHAPLGQSRRFVRVDRHGREHSCVTVGQVGAPARCFQIGSDLHDALDPCRNSAVEAVLGRERVVPVRDLEVGVVVVHGDRQRFGQRRKLEVSCEVSVRLFSRAQRFRHGLLLDAGKQRIERRHTNARRRDAPLARAGQVLVGQLPQCLSEPEGVPQFLR